MDLERSRVTRRGFLAGTIAAALAACTDGADDASTTTPSSRPATTSEPDVTADDTTATTSSTTTSTTTTVPDPIDSDPFTLGVSSGDPLADSVILWTRLVPAEPLPSDDIAVDWEMATDESMTDIVAGGTATAVAGLGHSVHVEATGLEPDSVYHYRFRVGAFESATARTRTFAAPGTTPERFRFAFSSCQNWEQGYYTAYRDMLEQGDLDAFVFLGDYIYEYESGEFSDPRGRPTGQDFECVTVDEYRARYELYLSDPLLRAAHAHVPWIITWDDHEVDNDYAGVNGEDDAAVDAFLERRAAGYQVWYEHMPVRLDPPTGAEYPIHRSFAHGDLIRFHVLDTRQYRSDQQRNEPFIEALGPPVQERDEVLANDPDHTMLGAEQRTWLEDGVAESTAIWDVLAQQVFMFGANAIPGADPPIVVVDTWDGYAGERERVLESVGASAENLVVLTGDFHSAAVGQLRSDPFDLSRPVIGAELMASSISSGFFDDVAEVADLVGPAVVANPQIQWFDARRGYTICDVTPDGWRATFRAVADPFDEASAVDEISEWQIAAGTPGAVQV